MNTVTKTTVRASLATLVLMAAFLLGSALPSLAQATLYAPPTATPDVTAPYSGLWLGTHLWMADHLQGLCRLDLNAVTGIYDYNRATCKTDAIAPTQPSYDAATHMVYVGDTSAKSFGVYRYQFDPVTETMSAGALIAPSAGLGGNQPMSTAIGPDGALYIGFQKNGNIVRVPNPSGLTFTQTVQTIGGSSDGKRVVSMTFVGSDLWLAETLNVTKIANAISTTCTGGCKAAKTVVSVQVPTGIYYDKVANALWIASTPQTVATVFRYTFATNVTDVMDTTGIMPDGTSVSVFFIFGFAQDPSGNIYFGDDPSAGQSPFVGHIWKLLNGSVPVVGGTAPPPPPPGPAPAPAPSPAPLPPPLPALAQGVEYSIGETAPNGGVWMGTHFWVSDNLNGFCRLDLQADGLYHMNLATCRVDAVKPGQPAYDAVNQVVYVPDFSATKSTGVWRYHFDPVSETIVATLGLAPNFGLGSNAPDAVALNPDDGNVYVGFLKNGNIVRITNPLGGAQLVQSVGGTSDGRKSKGLTFIKNGANPANLWIAETARVTFMFNPSTCTGGCKGIVVPALDLVAPFAITSDGVDKIYWSNTSLEFSTSDIDRYTISTNTNVIYANTFLKPDGTIGRIFSSFGVSLDPAGNLYIGDDPNGGLAPNFQGHVTKVNLVP